MFARRSYNVAPDIIDAGQGGGGSGNITNTGMPIGSVVPFAGSIAPTNWLVCDGTEVRNDVYFDLYNVIFFSYGINPNVSSIGSIGAYSYTGNVLTFALTGTGINQFLNVGTIVRPAGFVASSGADINGTYITITTAPAIGATGTATGTFAQPISGTGAGTGANVNRASITLPDLRLKNPVGTGAGISVASTGGATTQTLTITNLPPHSHTLWVGGADASQGSVNTQKLGFPNVDTGAATGGTIYAATNTPTSGSRTQQVGQDGTGQTSFSIRNPYVGMNYIIHARN